MAPARRLPRLIGAAAVLLVSGVAFLPQSAPEPRSGPATIPDRMAAYSYLTGSVSGSPPGRAVALFQHGFGVEFLDFPQAIVVGADGDVYRRLDEAEERAGQETQGDPAPMLLSPQGTHVAVGDHDMERPDLPVVDLRTGNTSLYPLPSGRSVVPLAWSPDGSQIAYQFSAEPTPPHSGFPIAGDVGLLDTQTGKLETLSDASDVWTAAFDPDGTELALQHIRVSGIQQALEPATTLTGGSLEIVSLVGNPPRVLEAQGRYLDGPAAWSPDGRFLAVTTGRLRGPTEISFVDVTGQGRLGPDPLQVDVLGSNRVLGWIAPDEVAVLTEVSLTEGDPDPGTYWITAVPLDGGDPRRLTAIPGGSNYGVARLQLASALLPDLRVRPASDTERGPWPLPLRVAVALFTGLAVTAVASVAMNRRKF